MATTFVKVEDHDKIQELWKAGHLWRRFFDQQEPRHVPYKPFPLWYLTFAHYGYMVED